MIRAIIILVMIFSRLRTCFILKQNHPQGHTPRSIYNKIKAKPLCTVMNGTHYYLSPYNICNNPPFILFSKPQIIGPENVKHHRLVFPLRFKILYANAICYRLLNLLPPFAKGQKTMIDGTVSSHDATDEKTGYLFRTV
ncbi:hypothetical protein Echvi_1646 [Echinicola vietnamensis DSM 17526]|uniref:Uncharacterized protein n=1 Tax=Echinicola vietnamensis (strain DSM 17526 / LMG 23754 / KMM 6221) TaxID=926556 RepID=L0FYS4_ECHVK|nr:hypothetical protein Echvi_1646 [Echinicola vietnamensis DSM 17526]